MTEINKPMYGVWIYGKGWVKGKDNQAYADYNKEVAQELARRLGNNAKVYFIDPAIVDIENKLLEAEKYKPKGFHRLLDLFGYLSKKKEDNNAVH